MGNVSNVAQLEPYDIVACDLRGVGVARNERLQGASIIEETKRLYPDKYVIVYSGSFARSAMVQLALEKSDDNIAKSADLDRWIKVLDDAVSKVSDPVERWKRIKLRVVELSIDADEFARAEDAYVRSIIKGDKRILERQASNMRLSEDLRAIVRSLITSAIWGAITA